MDLERFPTSVSARRMLASVSEEFYAKSYVAKWLYQVMGLEWDDVWSIIDALPEQAFVETATWGLMYHELKWGLPVRENLDYETRRRLIYEKRDVRKPMNPWYMERLLANLTGGSIRIQDSNDDLSIPANTFTVRMLFDNPGVDISSAIRVIQQVKQSHVGVTVRIELGERSAPLRVGVTGSIITRLAPVEQPDDLSAAHTVYMGGAAQTIVRAAPTEQPDDLTAAQTLCVGGLPETIIIRKAAKQLDRPPRPQTIRTGGAGAVITTAAPGTHPERPPRRCITRTGGAGTIISVLRGRNIG